MPFRPRKSPKEAIFHFAQGTPSGKKADPARQVDWIGSSMVEQLTLNQLVEGSSPSRSTKFLSGSAGDLGFLKKRRSCTFLALWKSTSG
jgi:hypothetical protein